MVSSNMFVHGTSGEVATLWVYIYPLHLTEWNFCAATNLGCCGPSTTVFCRGADKWQLAELGQPVQVRGGLSDIFSGNGEHFSGMVRTSPRCKDYLFILKDSSLQSAQGPKYDLNMSASIKPEQAHKGGRDWLASIAESSLVLSSVIKVIHPKLFEMGIQAMRAMQRQANLMEVLNLWYSIFNGVSVISNREAPIHRDNLAQSEWYDLLATVGPYHGAIFELPGLGIRLAYDSGTVIGLCGRVLKHGVSDSCGERICLAYYMRGNVQRRLGTTSATWSNWDLYRDHI
jgi:hypothetical protein